MKISNPNIVGRYLFSHHGSRMAVCLVDTLVMMVHHGPVCACALSCSGFIKVQPHPLGCT